MTASQDMAPFGSFDDVLANPHGNFTTKTVERIVEVPVIQIVEKIVEVPIGKWHEYMKESQSQVPEKLVASFDTPLMTASDRSLSRLHPAEAYLDLENNRQQSLDFFRDHGFLIIPDAVPDDLLASAGAAVQHACSRDNGSPEVLALLTKKVWDVVRLFVADPVLPVNGHIASVQRFTLPKPSREATKTMYFPNDVHIDGLPSEATEDIMNFTVLVGVPLDAVTEPFMGNFMMSPGSHVRLQDAIRSEGCGDLSTRDWQSTLKRMSGAETHPFVPLKVVPGQAYIVHYQTLHCVMPNLEGPDLRRVAYFRIWNKRGEGFYMQSDLSCLTDIFKEFPAISGVPVTVPALLAKPIATSITSCKLPECRDDAGDQSIPFRSHSGFIPNGGDLFVGQMTVAEAVRKCPELPGCKGFTFNGQDEDDVQYSIHFKDFFEVLRIDGDSWTSYQFNEAALPAKAALRPASPFSIHDGVIPAGGDILVAKMTTAQALEKCKELEGCRGFTFNGSDKDPNVVHGIYFKNFFKVCPVEGMTWTSFKYEPGPPASAQAS